MSCGWKRRRKTLGSTDHLWSGPEVLKLYPLSSAWSIATKCRLGSVLDDLSPSNWSLG